MASKGIQYVIVLGVLIIFGAVGDTAVALNVRASGGGGGTLPVAVPVAAPVQNTLTVVGTGQGTTVPDEATVLVGVSATRANVKDAVNAANADMKHLLSALHGQGVQDKDIQTLYVSINQQTNCCPSYVTGYSSAEQVSVTVHHIANVNPLIEASVNAVGNDIQLNGINLFVSNPTAQLQSARTAAMADATARAQAWAKLAGHHVGNLLALSETVVPVSYSQCSGGCGGAGGGGLPIQAGQTTLVVTITAVYELQA